MQERLELIFNLFPLGPQVDHNIKECSPWQHNPGRNVVVWVSCGRDFTLNALICTNRINIIPPTPVSQWVTESHWLTWSRDSTLYPSLTLFQVSVRGYTFQSFSTIMTSHFCKMTSHFGHFFGQNDQLIFHKICNDYSLSLNNQP